MYTYKKQQFIHNVYGNKSKTFGKIIKKVILLTITLPCQCDAE